MSTTPISDQAAAVIDLGSLVLDLGRVERATYHQDGRRPETDTDHTVMLGLLAPALAGAWGLPFQLDLGLVAQFALVHDVVEARSGDVSTLRALTPAQKAAKRAAEHEAYLWIDDRFGSELPWLPMMIARYESQDSPEARFVKALDKLLPKITHIRNGAATIIKSGVTADELEARYNQQRDEIAAYAADFPRLLQLREELAAQVLAIVRAHEREPR